MSAVFFERVRGAAGAAVAARAAAAARAGLEAADNIPGARAAGVGGGVELSGRALRRRLERGEFSLIAWVEAARAAAGGRA